ncbi:MULTISPECIES: hypothetical protein [unclassified Mesorhizobium]|uniref:hypothetical protein n=1 Tax=unclassified Mesorhizobium TaxID=325217 RepID=UPI001678A1AC|nr:MULTISPECIES: hypothetical protein [unclassified Mesorhizobium]
MLTENQMKVPAEIVPRQENAEETRHVPSELEHEDLADARCWNAGDRPLLTGRVGSCS